jgi:hypothetical protein
MRFCQPEKKKARVVPGPGTGYEGFVLVAGRSVFVSGSFAPAK